MLSSLFRGAAPPAAPPAGGLSACVIVPTNGRPELLRHTLSRIGAQEYDAPIRVVVVDDSPAELQLAPNEYASIRRAGGAISALEVVTPSSRQSVGQKRNLAVERCADAEVVVHWDDDDFYAPSRLTAQLAPIKVGRRAPRHPPRSP